MKSKYLTGLMILIACLSPALYAQQNAHENMSASETKLYSPTDIQWQKGPASLPAGAEFAVLEGDPAKEGIFVMRLRLPNDYHIPAHTHPKIERITIIQGTLKLAMGDNPKLENAHILPTGAFGVWPAGMVHAVWTEGETILQLNGVGPWVIKYVNPSDDPRNAKTS